MATWNDLVAHVKKNYKVNSETGTILAMGFDLGPRSQVVFVRRGGNESVGEWASVMSPIAKLSPKALETASRECWDKVCGGVAVMEDTIFLKDSFPLANLDVNEFEGPLLLITTTADALEKIISGGDKF